MIQVHPENRRGNGCGAWWYVVNVVNYIVHHGKREAMADLVAVSGLGFRLGADRVMRE